MGKRPMTVRIARWSAQHPWRAIALWVVFVAVCLVGGNAAGLQQTGDQGSLVGEAGRANDIVASGGFDHPAVENVLITAPSGALDQDAAMAAATDAANRLRTTPGVAEVGQPMPNRDGSAVLLPVTMAGDPDTAGERVGPLLDVTAAVQAAHPELRIEQTGPGSIDKAMEEVVGEDFERAELLSLPVTLVILLIAFGALIAAGIPVLLAMSSVMAAMGLSTIASHLVPANDATASVILLIGMAVGVDYSLFYVRREREERAKGRSRLDAIDIAAETSGRAVVVSGVAVIIAMSGLFLANDTIFASFAVGSGLVVAVAVAGSLTVLPAVLAKLGRWIDRPRVPLLWRLTTRRTGPDGKPLPPRFWPTVLRPALRHPRTTLVVSAGLLLALTVPALDMKLSSTEVGDLPRTKTAMQAYHRLTEAFPSTGTRHVVAVRAEADQAEAVRAALTGLARTAAEHPLFTSPETNEPHIESSADGRVTVLELPTPYASRTEEARRSLEVLRTELAPAALDALPSAEYAVGGAVAASLDYAADIRQKLPLVVGFVLILTFLAMMVTFRSPVVALTSIALNLLSTGAAYGLLVLVFQNTWAEGLLGFTSTGAIVTWVPLFLFVILFGLSMDYHVFVVSRIREAARGGMPNREAVAHGIVSSAGVVSSAAVVMVGVFSIFATLSMIEMKQLGIGLAVAILIDATIIRAVVLPSAMTLLGRANWWAPRFLRERSPRRPDHSGPVAEVAPAPELAATR